VKPPFFQRGQHVGIAGRVDHDRHARVVFAAARTMDGPPMHLLDALVGGRAGATVSANG